jgi:hypothetical protein
VEALGSFWFHQPTILSASLVLSSPTIQVPYPLAHTSGTTSTRDRVTKIPFERMDRGAGECKDMKMEGLGQPIDC